MAGQAYKGTLGPDEVTAALAQGVQLALPGARITGRPLADGGDGLLPVWASLHAGTIQYATVTGPDGRPVRARWWLGDEGTAVIEAAEACGLRLLGDRRLPLDATSRGAGELLNEAVAAGARSILLGIGGTASSDGGAGMLQALGALLLDRSGVPAGPGARGLETLAVVDVTPAARRLAFVALSGLADVTNPLLGPEGAAATYGPQKGADATQVARLEAALGHYARLADRRRLVADRPGAGAGGGIGFAVLLLGGTLRPGADLVLEAQGIPDLVAGADLVIAAEGRWDGTSLQGKGTGALVRLAQRQGVPAGVVAGAAGPGAPPGIPVEEAAAAGGIASAVDIAVAAARLAERLRPD